jgi:hypothetical protein
MARLIKLIAGSFAAICVSALATAASADTCWNHNGSIVRLIASGQQRTFVYEQPRDVLRIAGVSRGTILFNGARTGNRYSGTAYVFSRECPEMPLPYSVRGFVGPNDTQVTMTGSRPVFVNCRATGRMTTDTLVFTYVSAC